MSKFELKFACGHGTFVENIGGKVSERQRKADWYEANRLCPECYKAKKRTEEAEAPKTFEVNLSTVYSDYSVSVEVYGQLSANAEALFSAGYARGPSDFYGGAKFCFSKNLGIPSSKEELGKLVNGESQFLVGLGYQNRTYIDQKRQELILALIKAKAENPYPERPAFYQAIRDLYGKPSWNKKVYGRPGGYNIYVCNVRHDISDDQYKELMDFLSKCEASKKAIKKVQEQG